MIQLGRVLGGWVGVVGVGGNIPTTYIQLTVAGSIIGGKHKNLDEFPQHRAIKSLNLKRYIISVYTFRPFVWAKLNYFPNIYILAT